MDSSTISLILLAGLAVFGVFSMLKLFRWLNKRYYRNLLRGNLREDYIRNNPDHVRGGSVSCRCGHEKIVLRNLGLTRLEGSDVVREHVCHQCGARLFYSVSGDYLEGIVSHLRKEAGYEDGAQALTVNG